MSIPRNHHFVSEVHQKKFFNYQSNRIYVYDKQRKNLYSKKTTKTLFSERDSNTSFNDGTKDFTKLEGDLNINFEQELSNNIQIVEDFIKNREMNESINDALFNIARFGVIGEFRTPRNKKGMDDALWEGFSKIMVQSTPELKKGLEEVFAFRKEVKYSNVLTYSETANSILELMGGLIFKIIIPENNDDYFVLPDCSSIRVRDKINDYFNPDIKEIAYIGVPVTSKMFIHFFSEKLFKENMPISEIIYEESQVIRKINIECMYFSQGKIACESEEYLEQFISSLDD